MMNSTPRRSALTILLVFTFCLAARAQDAQVTGQITDQIGAVVPGVEVTITSAATGVERTAVTNDDGYYTVPLLPPGTYRIAVRKAGFRPIAQEDTQLAVEQTARLDFTLETGDVSETVTVSGDTPILSQETSSLGTVVDSRKIINIPLNGRSPFRLVQLTPGVISSNSANGQFQDIPVNTTFDTNFSINGGRNQSNEILIDGVPSTAGFFNQITTIPSVEATQEFKVESNNASAEFGRFGGGVVNVSTRSGGNSLDGSLYEFVRNDRFDANDFFNNAAGRRRPSFRQNQFGYAFSAPVYLPRFGEGGRRFYSGRNRTFFFTDYQGTRYRRGDVYTNRVPTLAERNGDFSASLGAIIPNVFNPDGSPARINQIYDPATTRVVGGVTVRDPFPGNIIPQARINPVARRLADFYPLPNTSGVGVNNFVSNAKRSIDQNQIGVRIDHNVSDTYRIFGRFSRNNSALSQPDYFGNVASPDLGSVGTTLFRYRTFALDNTFSVNPTTTFNLRYGYARWFQFRNTRSFGFDQTTLGFPASLVSQFQVPVFPNIGIEQYAGLGGQSFFKNGNDTHSVLPSITKTTGRQTIKTGADLRLRRINFFDVFAAGGQYGFNRVFTRGPNFNTNLAVGNGFASFLLGTPQSGSAPQNAAASLQNYYGALYVQDDIKLTPKLTINLGVRYEVESPYTERYNRLVAFDADAPSPARNREFPNLLGALRYATTDDRHVYDYDLNNIAPRVGFAYSPFERTVLRGGFGISYAPLETSNNAVGFIPNAGFSAATPLLSTTNGGQTTIAGFGFSNPFPSGLNQPTGSALGASTFLGQGLSVLDADPETPYVMQWNLNVQRELPFDILFDVAYAASRGVHLTRPRELNALDPRFLSLRAGLQTQVPNPFQSFVTTGPLSQATVQQRQLLLPFPQYTSVNVINSTSGNSIYHSLQTKLDKRLSSGVNFLVAYTFSKLISDTTNQLAGIGDFTNFSNVQNFYDLRAERALSELDTPHSLAVSTVIELPFGRGRRFLTDSGGFVGRLVEGFQLNGVARYESGNPLSFSAAVPTFGGNRPVFTGQPLTLGDDQTRGEQVLAWFNPAAFANPADFTLGDVGRTVPGIRGPAFRNVDLSIIKNTRISEGSNLQLRAEFFNAFNIVNLGLPVTNRNDPTRFGRIFNTRGLPRVVQFAVKYNF